MPIEFTEDDDPQQLPKLTLCRLANQPVHPWRHLSHNGSTFKLGRWTADGCDIQTYTAETLRPVICGATFLSYLEVNALVHLPVRTYPRSDHELWLPVVALLDQQWPFDAEPADPEHPDDGDTHSGRTRVAPTFNWLSKNGGINWAEQLLQLSEGIRIERRVGQVQSCNYNPELRVQPSLRRLAWMIRNAHRLVPLNARQWRAYQQRVIDNPCRDAALAILDAGERRGNLGDLALEGETHCDCYLLALCEGNLCRCGRKGRTPGGGRIQLFEKKRKRWRHIRALELPPSLPFIDYSGMSTDRGRVAIVSQESSMLWIGQFDEAGWGWHNAGLLYEFPRFGDGSIQYGNIEGVAWISPTRIVTVSDRRKKRNQPDERLSEKDQSVHIFEIPS